MYLQLFKNIFVLLLIFRRFRIFFWPYFLFLIADVWQIKESVTSILNTICGLEREKQAFRQNQRINEPNASNFMNDLHQGGCGGI